MFRIELGASQSEGGRIRFYIGDGSFLHLRGLEQICIYPPVCVQTQPLDLPLIKCKIMCSKLDSALAQEKRILI